MHLICPKSPYRDLSIKLISQPLTSNAASIKEEDDDQFSMDM